MAAKERKNKIRNILLAVLPSLLVAGLVFAVATTYYDVDLGKVMIEEVTKIVGQLESTATTTLATLGGNVGIGTTTPSSLLTVGSGGGFKVDSSGDIVKIKSLTYSWPSSHTANGYLKNDGSGNLIWATVSAGVGGSGTAGQVAFWTASDTLSGSNNLFWSTSTSRLGIGTTGPQEKLTLASGSNFATEMAVPTNVTSTGATRVHKLVFRYAASTTADIDWRVSTSTGAYPSSTLPQPTSDNLEQGNAYIATTTISTDGTDWWLEVKTANEADTVRIFQIFLAAYDQID